MEFFITSYIGVKKQKVTIFIHRVSDFLGRMVLLTYNFKKLGIKFGGAKVYILSFC
jgi:hypothetical protein